MSKVFLPVICLLISIDVFSQDNLKIDVGDLAYNFSGTDGRGNEIQIADYRGDKYVLLNFTATWCGPCWKTYIPMNEVQKIYREKLKVISFHIDDTKDMWKSMADKSKIEFECTSVWEAKNKLEIQKIYNPDGLPYFFLINKDGVVVEKWYGNREQKLKKILKKNIK